MELSKRTEKKTNPDEWQYEYKLKHNSRSKPLTWPKKNSMYRKMKELCVSHKH